MDRLTGRPNHIQDVLITLHNGQWFKWSDIKNKTYENLILADKIWSGTFPDVELIDNPYVLPSEEELNSKLVERQSDFDAQEYARKRQAEYPSIEECVHAILDDDLENLQILRQAVKNKFPKENT